MPKRHARRSVTRSLLKRQMRAAAERHEQALAPGLWLLRLRSAFPVKQFPSADSSALRAAARAELEALLQGPLHSVPAPSEARMAPTAPTAPAGGPR